MRRLRRLGSSLGGQRGTALPLALIALLILSAVILALSTLSATEPTIASNQLMTAQALALAEAGLERALWALDHPGDPGGVPEGEMAPPPYDGSLLVPLAARGASIGGFRVTIGGETGSQREVTVVGWVPSDSGPGPRTQQRIKAGLVRLRFPGPPAAVSVRGELRLADGATVEASGDGSCGDKPGTWSAGATTLDGASQVWGRDGSPSPNEASDVQQHQPPGAFDARAYTAAELRVLRAVARARGTYYRGAVAFDAANRISNGLVFVDTTTGQPITDTMPDSELAAVRIGDGAVTDRSGVFRGWLVVNGSLAMSGDFQMEGFAYVADRLSQRGGARILGGVMAGHIRDASASLIESRPATGPAVAWSCDHARTGGGEIPQRWLVQPGSYRETAG